MTKSGLGFCFYCRKIWFLWQIECGALRRQKELRMPVPEAGDLIYFCPVGRDIGQKLKELSRNHSIQVSSPWSPPVGCFSPCFREMTVLGLWVPGVWSFHQSSLITNQLQEGKQSHQESSGAVWPLWLLHGLRGGLLQRGLQHGMCRRPSLQASKLQRPSSCGLSVPLLALWALNSVKGVSGISQETFVLT